MHADGSGRVPLEFSGLERGKQLREKSSGVWLCDSVTGAGGHTLHVLNQPPPLFE